jgi:hypothetical protein
LASAATKGCGERPWCGHDLCRQGRRVAAELQRPATIGRQVLWAAGRRAGRRTQPAVRVLRHSGDLWADINARGALIEHNLKENNWAEEIFHKVSQDAVIRNNLIYRNGIRAKSWYWDGGITVASSFNVRGLRPPAVRQPQWDHRDPAEPTRLDSAGASARHDNLICATGAGGHPTGVMTDNGAKLGARDISFTRNTSSHPPASL